MRGFICNRFILFGIDWIIAKVTLRILRLFWDWLMDTAACFRIRQCKKTLVLLSFGRLLSFKVDVYLLVLVWNRLIFLLLDPVSYSTIVLETTGTHSFRVWPLSLFLSDSEVFFRILQTFTVTLGHWRRDFLDFKCSEFGCVLNLEIPLVRLHIYIKQILTAFIIN